MGNPNSHSVYGYRKTLKRQTLLYLLTVPLDNIEALATDANSAGSHAEVSPS